MKQLVIASRPARTAPTWVNGIKSIGYTASLWVVFLFAIPAMIVRGEARFGWLWLQFHPGFGRIVASCVFWAAAAVGFWSGYVLIRHGDGTPMPFECTHNLVVEGPYRYIRNPMSAMAILQGACAGWFVGSLSVILYSVAGH